jgi:Ankyrin repeats (many copies)
MHDNESGIKSTFALQDQRGVAIACAIFGGSLLVFIAIFTISNGSPTCFQQEKLRFFTALCAAFLSYFFAGGVVFKNKFIGATGGFALFLLIQYPFLLSSLQNIAYKNFPDKITPVEVTKACIQQGSVAISIASPENKSAGNSAIIPAGIEPRRIYELVSDNNVPEIATLLQAGWPIKRYIDSENNMMLHLAAERCNAEMVEFLIENGAVNSSNRWGDTPKSIARARCGENSQAFTSLQRAFP